jgi:hypothetical protein
VACIGLAAGCQKKQAGEVVEAPIPSKVKMSVIPGLTVDAIKSKLGSAFTQRSDGPVLVLVRSVDPQEVVVAITHDNQGAVNFVSLQVAGPPDTNAKIEELYVETARLLGEALEVTDPSYPSHIDLGTFKTHMNVSYGFLCGKYYFSMTPNVPVHNTSKTVTFKAKYVQRGLAVGPQLESEMPREPIQDATLAQLESMLKDYVVKLKVEGKEIIYVREKPTHTDVVCCSLDPQGGIARVEAFVGDVKEGDIFKLNDALWLEMTDFEYKGSNKEKAIAFLTGPMMEYAAPEGKEVGRATYFLPVGLDGTRKHLNIFPSEPPPELQK